MIVAQQPPSLSRPDGANDTAPSVIVRPELLRRNHPVAQPLVRSLLMIVRHVVAHELAQMTLSAKAFKFGLFDGSRTGFTPALFSSVDTAAPNSGSRSWIR
jgi:hypothetical protein